MRTTELPVQTEPSPTTRAIAAAHDGHIDKAIDGVRWIRRGFLRRLVREELPG
jgi:hypothetical protein